MTTPPLATEELAAEELPAAGPLPQVGQLYVFPAVLGNEDDRAGAFPAHVGQNAEDAPADRAVDVDDADVLAPAGPQVAQVKESVRPVYPPLEKVCAALARLALPPTQVGHAAAFERAAVPKAPIDDNDIVLSPRFVIRGILLPVVSNKPKGSNHRNCSVSCCTACAGCVGFAHSFLTARVCSQLPTPNS